MDFSFLENFKNVRWIVAGEVGIDEYIWGDSQRLSPEAPVPIVEVEKREFKLGLAGNVAQNLVSLGARVRLITVAGEDDDSRKLSGMIREAGISATVTLDGTRPTLRKTRVLARNQHLVRVDYERSHRLEARLAKDFTEKVCDELASHDGVIVQDYGKGIWNTDTMAFVKHAQALKKPVFVDPSRLSPMSLYYGATLLTPNLAEAAMLCGVPHESSKTDDVRLHKLALQILEGTGAEHSVVTCGDAGMVAVSRSQRELLRIPTYARDVFDVTGAGDTVIAVLSTMLVLGHPLRKCMQVANAAAGIVVGQVGAASVRPEELRAELERVEGIGLLNS